MTLPTPPSPPLRLPLLIAGLATLALLFWLVWRPNQPPLPDPASVTARPALWQASKNDSQLWLFGTIHITPKGEPWLSPAIAQAAQESDRLFLEVTGLDAERKSRAVFERLGRADGLPPIEARLSPADAAHYRTFARDHGSALRGLDGYESWAAALLVNAAAASTLGLSASEAGEAVLLNLFDNAGKPVRGLESIEQQLGGFDALPEAEQRQLLAQSIVDAADARTLYRTLHGAWARGDIALLEQQFLAPMARMPALHAALVDRRNMRWAQTLDTAMREGPGTAFVAVGAGHLLGESSVQARLESLGWRVARVQ